MRFATLASLVGTFVGGLAVGGYFTPYTEQMLIEFGINPTKDAQASSAWLKAQFAALDREKQCKAGAQLTVNYEQQEFDRWAEQADYCLRNTQVGGGYVDREQVKADCKSATDALDKRKERLAAAEGALRACKPTKS